MTSAHSGSLPLSQTSAPNVVWTVQLTLPLSPPVIIDCMLGIDLVNQRGWDFHRAVAFVAFSTLAQSPLDHVEQIQQTFSSF